MRTDDYNEVFSAALRSGLGTSSSDYPLKSCVEELTRNNEVEKRFPGRSKLWLQKELSKWRAKLGEEPSRFCATLQSLQIYCTLTGQLPNDVLLPSRRYSGPARVEFLSKETILDLAREMRESGEIPLQGCALPVLYAPEQMTAVFLFLYSQKTAGREAVCMRFGVSEPDGYVDVDGSECTGGISTALDSSYYTADLSRPDALVRLADAYDKIRGEFEAVCAATESQLGESIREFYAMMGDWAHADRADLLFSWYPPVRKNTAQKRSLDSLRGTFGFAGVSER